jgi:cell division protein FtsW
LINFTALGIIRSVGLDVHWIHFSAWVVCAAVGHWWLERYLPRRDQLLFPLAMFLCGWGILLIDRLLPPFADRQTLWLITAAPVMLLVATSPQPLRWLRSYRYILLLIGFGLLISTILLGRNPSGQIGAPALWLGFNSIYFQPSEPLKIILVAFLASYLAEQHPILRSELLRDNPRGLVLSPRVAGPILLMWGISIVILVWQRDLGTAGLFFIVFLLMLYVASGSTLILIGGFILILIAGFAAYHLFSVVELRVDIWLNPWPESDGRAYQIVQSLQAFAAGSIWGEGIAQGLPLYIPVIHSDFAFAALAEEWGLLGVIVVTGCLAMLVARALRIAILQSSYSFHSLLAIGLGMLLAVQSLMIMAGVLKLVPLTGVTLPFISYGGSSLLVSFIIIGLLLRLSATEETRRAAQS